MRCHACSSVSAHFYALSVSRTRKKIIRTSTARAQPLPPCACSLIFIPVAPFCRLSLPPPPHHLGVRLISIVGGCWRHLLLAIFLYLLDLLRTAPKNRFVRVSYRQIHASHDFRVLYLLCLTTQFLCFFSSPKNTKRAFICLSW